MEVYKSKKNLIRKTKFPKYDSKKGISAFFAYLLSIFIWALVLIAGFVALYTYWFSRNLVYLMNLIDPKPYRFPFGLALLLVLLPVTFPFTLAIIFIGTLIKMIRN